MYKNRRFLSSRRQLVVACALAGFGIAGSVHAAWNDGGLDVISFNSTNPEKVLFKDKVYSGEQGLASDRTNWNTGLSNDNTLAYRALNSFKPYASGVLGFTPSSVSITPLTTSNPTIYLNTRTSVDAAPCTPGATNCAMIGTSVGTSSCINHEISISADLGFTKALWGGEAAGVVNGTYTRGWSQCKTSSTNHSCPAGNGLSFPSLTYATSEMRAKHGWATLKAANSSIIKTAFSFSSADISSFQNACNAAGGSYFRTTTGGTVPKTELRCTSLANKVKWEDYGHWPTTNGAVAATCRVIKDI